MQRYDIQIDLVRREWLKLFDEAQQDSAVYWDAEAVDGNDAAVCFLSQFNARKRFDFVSERITVNRKNFAGNTVF